VIIACYGYCGPEAISGHRAHLVFVDERNRIKSVRTVSVLETEEAEKNEQVQNEAGEPHLKPGEPHFVSLRT